jgi:MerR family copper efflux transcriptional regulator
MKIGELAEKAGLNAQTIRYYEREGILPEPRRRYDSGYREYEEDALQRLLFIKQAKNAGFKLSDVKQLFELELLPEEACSDVGKFLSERIEELDTKIKELKTFSRSLKQLKVACDKSEDGRCAVLDNLRG